jgi:hypothetical protein
MKIRFTGCARHWHPYGHGSCAQTQLDGKMTHEHAHAAIVGQKTMSGIRRRANSGEFRVTLSLGFLGVLDNDANAVANVRKSLLDVIRDVIALDCPI